MMKYECKILIIEKVIIIQISNVNCYMICKNTLCKVFLELSMNWSNRMIEGELEQIWTFHKKWENWVSP